MLEGQSAIHCEPACDLLLGAASLKGIGPGGRRGSADRIEMLAYMRFSHSFRVTPRVTPFVLRTVAEDGETAGCDLDLHAVTAEGFTVGIQPQPGSGRMTVLLGWVAEGSLIHPENARVLSSPQTIDPAGNENALLHAGLGMALPSPISAKDRASRLTNIIDSLRSYSLPGLRSLRQGTRDKLKGNPT